MKFSANLGFLWTELTLPGAIRAAHASGFDAVEFHWPYGENMDAVKAELKDTGLPALGLNTVRGADGENGLAALPGRERDAQSAVDQALEWAVSLDIPNIHVMAGFASGDVAHNTFVSNLQLACEKVAKRNKTILIEPLNRHDAPGYFLHTTDQAVGIIEEVEANNLKLMFDCYHVQRSEGDVCWRLENLLRHIGHIQFAGAPNRGRPDEGELNYAEVFRTIEGLGYDRPLGAEYKPGGATENSLGWMDQNIA